METVIDSTTNPDLIGLHCLNGHNIFIKEKKMDFLKCSGKFSICGETKPISEFNNSPIFTNKPFGVDPTCKACRYARAKNNKKSKNTKSDDISQLVQDAVNKILKEKGTDIPKTEKILTVEERKKNLKPFTVSQSNGGGHRIRYNKTINNEKSEIYLASFADESEEKVLRKAETLKKAFNEILSINNIDFRF